MEAAATDLVAGRYRLGPVLGRGGMSEVRSAEDLRLARKVAVKVLRADLAEQPSLRRRFASEARAAARISHPHVVPIYDVGEHDGVPFIVMECLDGRTLADEFATGPVPAARAGALALQILSALGVAHREGVVHRDIKPGNVLLTTAGDAKVSDFGIAKVAENSDATTTGVLLGTPAYLAPECVAGEPASASSDIYAVGVLLFEALTATKPFTGETALAVLHAIMRAEPPRLAIVRTDLDPALVAIVERAMEKDPSARFPDAGEMIAALHAALTPSSANVPDPTVPFAYDETEVSPHAAATERIAKTESLPPEAQATRTSTVNASASRSRPRRVRSLVAVGLAALVIGGIGVLAVRDDEPPARTPTSAPPSGDSIPPDVERAIEELEEAVRP